MNTMPVYAFADAQGLRTYVDSDDFVFTGTWSSTGTYVADPYQAAQYGSMLYMCVTDNINRNPATVPTRFRPTRYWSPMVIVVGAGTTPADTAYQIATEAYALAVIGTNLGSLAYSLAETGSNLAWESFLLAQTGTAVAEAALEAANGAFSVATDAYLLAESGTNQVIALGSLVADIGTIATTGSDIAVAGSNVAWDAYLRATLQGPGICEGWVFTEAQGGCVGQGDVFSCDGQTVTLALVGCDTGSSFLLDITERKQFGPFTEDKIVTVTGQVVLHRPPGPSSCVVTGNYTNMTIGPDGPEPSSFWALPVAISGTFPISFDNGFLREGVPMELVFQATGNDGGHLASPTATITIAVAFSSAATQTAYNAASVAAEAYALASSGTDLANQALGALSIGLAGTYSVWVSSGSGVPADQQMFVVNGLVTSIV